MRKAVCLAGVLLGLCAGASAAAPQRYAVVIGVNDYADPAIPKLRYAESDAKAIYDVLTDPAVGRFAKENVAVLLGKDATPGNIKAALYKLRAVDKDDLVIVFFSGHGAKEGDEAFWVTQDAQRKALPATALSNTEIRKFLAGIPSQRRVVLLDCCYAASTVKKSLDEPGKLFGEYPGKGQVTIAGAADNQEALEMPGAKAGVFTHFLVAGLRGSADTNADGAVTFDELWAYLGQNVRKASVKQGGLHEPVIITDSGITPQFLLTWNPKAAGASDGSIKVLRKLTDEGAITEAQYNEGRRALTEPAIGPVATARREVYADLAAGRLSPKYLQDVLARRVKEAEAPQPVAAPVGEKPAVAIVPFEVYGDLAVKDAGVMLAERLLPLFGDRYTLIDQLQLRHFVDQDDLTIAGLAQAVQAPATKGLTKAVKLRAVRYLVVGSVSASPDGRLSITARLSDWQTGRIESGRLGQVAGDNWDDLLRRLPLLAAKLTGTIGEIGPGPDVTLPPLPSGVDALAARILQLEAIEAELIKAQGTLTEKHPRIAFLRDKLRALAKPLVLDVERKIFALMDADDKLAVVYKETHPQRAVIEEQIANLIKAKTGVLPRAFAAGSRQLALDLGGGATMKLVMIPAGKFMMGSPVGEKGRGEDEGPQREVTISKPFYMGVHEVTREQWTAVMGTKPWNGADAKEGGTIAASYITWDGAAEFCKKLSKKTGEIVSLPQEAQWEYACRAGSKTRFSYGDDDDYSKLGDYAWYDKNAEGYAHAVGRKKPNDYGLYDMHGNVSEWCFDWYDKDFYAQCKFPPAPPHPGPLTYEESPYGEGYEWGPDYGTLRVLRGGSFRAGGPSCRSAARSSDSLRDTPSSKYYGLRVAVGIGDAGLLSFP